MALAEIVYEQVKALPDPLKRQVLDFVEFLSCCWSRFRSAIYRPRSGGPFSR